MIILGHNTDTFYLAIGKGFYMHSAIKVPQTSRKESSLISQLPKDDINTY